jgi:hypothetical protein
VKAHSESLLVLALAAAACARNGSRDAQDTSPAASAPTVDTAASVPAPSGATAAAGQSGASGGRTSADNRGSARGDRGSAATPSGQGSSGSGRPPAPPGPGSSTSAGSDTARGIAAVTGSTPVTQVVLRPTGARSIALTGPLASEIGSASGADVWVRGRRVNDRTFEVASYAVRSVDGVSATTGLLVADGDRLVLVSDDGRRHVIARPPAPLRDHVGARVWVSGDLGTTITAYGVLRPRR